MSVSRQITILCDAYDCPKWVQETGVTLAVLRKQLRGRGWVHEDGKDYCPAHQVSKAEGAKAFARAAASARKSRESRKQAKSTPSRSRRP